MEHKFNINSKDYHKAMLTLMNFTLKLSELEIDIISIMLNNKMFLVTGEVRDLIRSTLNISKFNTNNYMLRLKNKKVLIYDKNKECLYLDPGIIDLVKEKKVSFEFVINDNN